MSPVWVNDKLHPVLNPTNYKPYKAFHAAGCLIAGKKQTLLHLSRTTRNINVSLPQNQLFYYDK